MNIKNKIIKDNLVIKGSKVDWRASVGRTVVGIYNGKEYQIRIIKYHDGESAITIECKERKQFKIKTNNFLKGYLGNFLGIVTDEFKVEVGARFRDKKRDITIIGREYRNKKVDNYNRKEKWYKYKCNECPNIAWIQENNLLNGVGCNVCKCTCPEPLLGYNTVYDLDEYTTKAIGEEFARTVTCGSDKEVYPICPECDKIKDVKMKIGTIHVQQSIGCRYCSDGVSYPNKFAHYLIEQLYNYKRIDYFQFEYSPEWAEGKKFDVYFIIKGYKYILEMDGELGHGNKQHSKSKITIEESEKIDQRKDNAAMDEGKIKKVIRVDCYYKNIKERFEYIKSNVLKELEPIVDLSNIDWNTIDKKSQSSLVKIACKFKSDNPDLSVKEIAKIMNMNDSAIRNYLKKGNELGLCIYDPKIEIQKRNDKVAEISRQRDSKITQVYKDGILTYDEDKNMAYIARHSLELFGTKLSSSKISRVCNGLKPSYKGFIFKFKNDSDINTNIKLSEDMKKACDLKRNNPDITTTEISRIVKRDTSTIIDYLKKGAKLNLCEYDPQEETRRRVLKMSSLTKEASSKPVDVFLNGILVDTCESVANLASKSMDIIGVKLNKASISRVCNGKQQYHKGYEFKFHNTKN